MIGLDRIVNGLRKSTVQLADKIPEWILFSLPDGLWTFSHISLNHFYMFLKATDNIKKLECLQNNGNFRIRKNIIANDL